MLVLLGSLFFVFGNVAISPDINLVPLSRRDLVAVFVAKLFLTIVSLAEIGVVVIIFLSPYHSVRSVAPEHHDNLLTLTSAIGVARQLYAATVLAGLVSLQLTCVVAPITHRGMQWLLVPSVTCHLAWLLSWTLLVASAARQRSTSLDDAALAVADALLILLFLATLIVGASFVVFVRLHRKHFAAENSNREAVLLVERGGNDDVDEKSSSERKDNTNSNNNSEYDNDNNDNQDFVERENDTINSNSSSFEPIPSTKRVVDATVSRIDLSDNGDDEDERPIPSVNIIVKQN